jgi:ribonuclease P protein component
MVVHANSTDARAGQPPRIGLVVSKAVGNAVVRNRTKRVVRALMSSRTGALPDGLDVVIRAKPDLPGTPTAVIAQDLDRLLAIVLRKASPRKGAVRS